MQSIIQAKKPQLVNNKLFPLLKRSFLFSGSKLLITVGIILFVASVITTFTSSNVIMSFFMLIILSNQILVGKYGVAESYIVSILPVSKKQAVLVKCCHLILTQIAVFGAIFGLSFAKLAMDDSTLAYQNSFLALAIFIISIVYFNILSIKSNFTTIKAPKNIGLILLGMASLFIMPVLLPYLMVTNDFLIQNVTHNQALTYLILPLAFAIYLFASTMICVYAIKNCTLCELDKEENDIDKDSSASQVAEISQDGLFLRLYIRLLRLIRVNESAIKLVRKDIKLTSFAILFGFYWVLTGGLYAYQWIFNLNEVSFSIFPSMVLSFPFIFFALTGEMKISAFLPVKRKDYIKSKLILISTMQILSVLSVFILELILFYFRNAESERYSPASICGVLIAHALSNLPFFVLIFRSPKKIHPYVISLVIYLAVAVVLMILLGAIANIGIIFAVLSIGFVVYILVMLLTWQLSKNLKGDM